MSLAAIALAASAALTPDVVYVNGNIVTVDPAFSVVQAVAVRDGRFVAVGSNGDVRELAGDGTTIVDLGGKTVGLGAYAAEALDADRERTQNPTKSLLDRGIRVSHGSDSAPYGPLITIWTAVTRKGFQGRVYGPEDAVTVEQAIRLHTLEPAYLTFQEDRKGSIEVGKLADMVVLGEDILTVEADRIRSIPIEATIVGGREIYRKVAGPDATAGPAR